MPSYKSRRYYKPYRSARNGKAGSVYKTKVKRKPFRQIKSVRLRCPSNYRRGFRRDNSSRLPSVYDLMRRFRRMPSRVLSAPVRSISRLPVPAIVPSSMSSSVRISRKRKRLDDSSIPGPADKRIRLTVSGDGGYFMDLWDGTKRLIRSGVSAAVDTAKGTAKQAAHMAARDAASALLTAFI